MKLSVSVLLLVVVVAALWPPPCASVPMVENSVKFALERCRQFLRLATFLREGALDEDKEGIGESGGLRGGAETKEIVLI